jgi:hypothetical protein
MSQQDSSTVKANRNSSKETTVGHPEDPRTAHKEDQITNADEQNEIVNEPNYKTDREEEENKNSAKPDEDITRDNPEIINPELPKKERPEAET